MDGLAAVSIPSREFADLRNPATPETAPRPFAFQSLPGNSRICGLHDAGIKGSMAGFQSLPGNSRICGSIRPFESPGQRPLVSIPSREFADLRQYKRVAITATTKTFQSLPGNSRICGTIMYILRVFGKPVSIPSREFADLRMPFSGQMIQDGLVSIPSREFADLRRKRPSSPRSAPSWFQSLPGNSRICGIRKRGDAPVHVSVSIPSREFADLRSRQTTTGRSGVAVSIPSREFADLRPRTAPGPTPSPSAVSIPSREFADLRRFPGGRIVNQPRSFNPFQGIRGFAANNPCLADQSPQRFQSLPGNSRICGFL